MRHLNHFEDFRNSYSDFYKVVAFWLRSKTEKMHPKLLEKLKFDERNLQQLLNPMMLYPRLRTERVLWNHHSQPVSESVSWSVNIFFQKELIGFSWTCTWVDFKDKKQTKLDFSEKIKFWWKSWKYLRIRGFFCFCPKIKSI